MKNRDIRILAGYTLIMTGIFALCVILCAFVIFRCSQAVSEGGAQRAERAAADGEATVYSYSLSEKESADCLAEEAAGCPALYIQTEV